MIEVRDVAKAFGATRVLADLDLVVDKAETVALVGPSGVGKSTLLRVIAGLETPDRGRVLVDGIDLADRPTHRRGIGYMFQDLALFPHLDVAGNIEFGLRMQKVAGSARTRRVADLLDLVGMADSASRDPGSLSGGERQRVALARALAPEPSVLLLDEPFGALDRTLRDHLLAEVRQIFDQLGLTVVAVTHDPTEAAGLADRIAVMHEGAIVQIGVPSELFSAPASRTVAAILGLRNVVEGPVVDGTVVVEGWGRFATGVTSASAGVLVPRSAIRVERGVDRPGPVDLPVDVPVDVTVDGVVLRDGQRLAVIRPVGGGAPLELDLGGANPGERCRVFVATAALHVMT